MAVLYMLFAKTVPIISVWELKSAPRTAPEHAPALAAVPQEGAD